MLEGIHDSDTDGGDECMSVRDVLEDEAAVLENDKDGTVASEDASDVLIEMIVGDSSIPIDDVSSACSSDATSSSSSSSVSGISSKSRSGGGGDGGAIITSSRSVVEVLIETDSL